MRYGKHVESSSKPPLDAAAQIAVCAEPVANHALSNQRCTTTSGLHLFMPVLGTV